MVSDVDILRFLSSGHGNGYGDGDGYGNGNGYGDGYGSGDGNGDGSGNGSGNGSGSGYGYGSGYGDGNGYGDGSGYGYGDGYGDGNGYGYGDGSGNGDGSGDGNGDGYGDGYGDGVIEIDGYKVHQIDNMPTVIYAIKGNYAKGATIRCNTILVPCYIAKEDGFFAHGETLHDAVDAVHEKYLENRPIEERIADIIKVYPSADDVVSNSELFNLHHILTGSCEFGRREFAESHGIDLDGSMTMRSFIELTQNAYGEDAIKALAEAYRL